MKVLATVRLAIHHWRMQRKRPPKDQRRVTISIRINPPHDVNDVAKRIIDTIQKSGVARARLERRR